MTALDDLVDDMASLLDAPCTLEDPDFRLVGFSDHRRADLVDEVRQRSILERRCTDEVRSWFHSHGIRAGDPIRTPADAERGVAARLCIPALHLGRVYGYFWLLEGEEPIPTELWPQAVRIAESAATLLNVAENRQVLRDAAYRQVVEGPSEAARRSATILAAAAGVDVHEPVVCVVVRQRDLSKQLSSRSERPGIVWVREDDEVAAAVVRADRFDLSPGHPHVLEVLGIRRRLTDLDEPTYVGIGPVSRGMDELMHSRAGARVALRVCSMRGKSVVDWHDLGPLALLGVARDDDLARALIDPQLRVFLREATPELAQTARVYLEEARSASRAARRLAVHRQTVYHRISQVERLSGCSLDTGAGCLRLHLALLLAPFLHEEW